ncbi:MAG: carbamoyl-phosphate synthase large subunit [Oscillospiraceae bacterium]|nr:carbamoyl-phosphate synthase large subunit [Oscillospiraceae bacterium]
MPLNRDIHKVLVIGSGPIVIGQAAEFDYSGTQACRALKEDGIEVVLVNSNPATIMTDSQIADKIYMEPLKTEVIKRICLKEKPDSILSGLGGQTGLNLCAELAESGFLAKHGIRLLGANPETIARAEDRKLFKETMDSIGQPCIPSGIAEDMDTARQIAAEIGYPVIIRPAFTLGGTGGGIADTPEEFDNIAENGLRLSPIHQILVERCIAGWKEIEFEIVRDADGNKITVCSMENFDPVGIHTGDSIVIAPAVTLSDKEYQMLRTAALKIAEVLKIEGGCNCQFALNPDSFEYAVIEVNPRVSRSSALASKATGYPIAKVAAKIAVGYRLYEIANKVTGKTTAAFEPALDYVAVKMPKFPFEKFAGASHRLGTQMKATGEVMAISDTFESALLKALRGAEVKHSALLVRDLRSVSDDELREHLIHADDIRLFAVSECFRRGMTVAEIHALSKIDAWFLSKIETLIKTECKLEAEPLTDELYRTAKRFGYPDTTVKAISNHDLPVKRIRPVYRMVDTCAGEFAAETPYFYGVYQPDAMPESNEAAHFLSGRAHQTVVVLGSGPIRIGQGIEFDYSAVHCVQVLKNAGYEVVLINNNPETVSTDFDTADRLYFEPLTPEDVLSILDLEQPVGVVTAFGGQTAIRLARTIEEAGYTLLGATADSIDLAEDRERFDALLESLQIERPRGCTVNTLDEAADAVKTLGLPVLVRPSYVLGGQNMNIAFEENDVYAFMQHILEDGIDNPVLIDQYIRGTEIEVDAICDGTDILIPGIMEHIERTGVHSGDSIAICPPVHIDDDMRKKILTDTKKICLGLHAVGLINLQYIVKGQSLYVIEVNPRASRTVPFMSKLTGLPLCDCAMRVCLGERLSEMEYGTGYYKTPPFTAVKVPVFSFQKIGGESQLGPEMKSTGEVIGIGKTLTEALYKGLRAAGYRLEENGKKTNGVLLTVCDADKPDIVEIARKFARLDFKLYATEGTADALEKAGLSVYKLKKLHSGDTETFTLMENGTIRYIVSTDANARMAARDGAKIRKKAVELGIPCLTCTDTAAAVANCLHTGYRDSNVELMNMNSLRTAKRRIPFVKMHGCGNDYIYVNCMEKRISAPESLSVQLSDRHFGIGGDGLVLIESSDCADAKMRMFNLDGSEGNMCGNAIRCVAKYLYDNGICPKKEIVIETKSGLRTVTVTTQNGLVTRASVDMGKAIFDTKQIPVQFAATEMIAAPLTVSGKSYTVTCVSMGNPHCVVFGDNPELLDLAAVGPEFEHHPAFPEQVNTEFVQVIDDHTLRMRVWERGSGETMACGTGACATVAAAVKNGFCKPDTDVTVHLNGGDLIVRYSENTVTMTGEAVLIFSGEIEV